MAEKQDYYAVLGVAKTASEAEIKKAFQNVAMKCHPDMLRNKSETEKAQAGEKLKLADEAYKVLMDPVKRSTYDRFGHAGVENLKNASTTGQTFKNTTATPARKVTEADAFSFFDERADRETKNAAKPPVQPPPPPKTSNPIADANAEARWRARHGGNPPPATTGVAPPPASTPPAVPPSAPPVADIFREVSEKIENTKERLKNTAVPLSALEQFRATLKDLCDEVDKTIDRTRKNGGPRP